jgi:dTDP-4-amino-4,6-dideoxygalactose transaminase
MPCFCDVDPTTHGLDPGSVARAINDRTTVILAVCNFNSAGHVEELCELAARHHLPIFFDSVDALGSTNRGRRLGNSGCAEVFSTHATKLLNGFEGGYITTDDAGLADTLRWQRDLAPPEHAPAFLRDGEPVLGLAAHFNELAAAMAYVALREIDSVIARNRARYEAYQRMCDTLPGLDLVPYPDQRRERSNFRMAVAEVSAPWPLSRDQTVAVLNAERAAISAYYDPPLHRSVHCPTGLVVPPLPVSEDLAKRFFHLPVGDLVSLDDVARLGDLLEFVSAHGAAIAERMAAMPKA